MYINFNECRARYSNILFLQIDLIALPMATNTTFYNPNRQDLTMNSMIMFFVFLLECRKRRALDERLIGNHQENTHRMSLMKMAHATRTFGIQSDALEFIEKRQKINNSEEILYLFSFESQPDGKRRYQVADIDIFIHEY